MTKREKQERIISHLQILRTWCAVNPDYGKGLSIDDCHKAVEWLDDAFDLLKAQEPHVMTIDDMRDLKRSDFAIIELISGIIVPVIVEENIELNNDLLVLQVVDTFGNQRVDADYEYYGKTWRCWTSKPTAQRRESVKWD